MEAAARARLMAEGKAAFRRHEFYEAHEFWEEVWDVADDPDRTWIQGMIQIATGLHKLARKRSDLCERLIRRALEKLRDAPAALDGMNLARLVSDARACADAIARGEVPEVASVRLEDATPKA